MKNKIQDIKKKFLNIYKLFKETFLHAKKIIKSISLSDKEMESFLLKNYIISFYIELWSFYNEIILAFFSCAIDESHFPNSGSSRPEIKIKNFFFDIVFKNKSIKPDDLIKDKWDNYEKTFKILTDNPPNLKFSNIYLPINVENLAKHFDGVNEYRNAYAHGHKKYDQNSQFDSLTLERLVNRLMSDMYLLNLIFDSFFSKNK